MTKAPVFGLWNLVAQRPLEPEPATPQQYEAVAYLIGDMPSGSPIGFESSRELLSVRSYTIGLLVNLDRPGTKFHPREAMWLLMREVYRDPIILKSIRKWSRDRYFEDRGPPRVGATRYFESLSRLVKTGCRLPAPSQAECIAVRDAQLHARGLGALVSSALPTIDYRDGDEVTTRTLSRVELRSQWPWWSYWLVGAPAFIAVDAFCHLREGHRTFAARKIVRARGS